MGRGGDAADWTSDPADTENLVKYFKTHSSRLGQGGNPDKQLLNDAAEYLHSLGAPKHGGPKTPDAIKARWGVIRRLHDYILQAMQKTYPGASGWTYTHELGFNVTPESQDAWHAFIKNGHPHFKPFANKGWDLWGLVNEILPSQAKGKYVFNASSGRSLRSRAQQSSPEPSADASQPLTPTQSSNDTASQSSDVSQPLTDWSQSDYGSQPPEQPNDLSLPPLSGLDQLASAASQIASSPLPVTPTRPSFSTPTRLTPAVGVKRAASDETDTPWSNKRTKTTGPEAIMFLGRGVMDIGGALRECFGTKSSAVSPTKKLARARALAEEDMQNSYISAEARLRLSLLFGRDITTADAYIAEKDGFSRADLARILLPDTYF